MIAFKQIDNQNVKIVVGILEIIGCINIQETRKNDSNRAIGKS